MPNTEAAEPHRRRAQQLEQELAAARAAVESSEQGREADRASARATAARHRHLEAELAARHRELVQARSDLVAREQQEMARAREQR